MTVRAHGRTGRIHEDTPPRLARAHGFHPRPRLHGHVGLLRRTRRRGIARHDPPRPRPRRDLSRHRRRLWPGPQRGAGRPRRAGAVGLGGGGHQIRQRPQPRRQLQGRRRAPRLCAPGLRGEPQALGPRGHRPLLPAPRRPHDRHRGDGRRHGGPRQGRQGQVPRPVGGRARHHPARPRGPPDHGAADRIFALDPRPRRRDPGRPARARHRLRALQPARPRFPHRPVPLRRRHRRRRLPPHHAALPGREPRRQPRPRRRHRGARARQGLHHRPGGARLGAGAGRRHRPHPRYQAAQLSRAEPRRPRRRADRGRPRPARPRAAARRRGRHPLSPRPRCRPSIADAVALPHQRTPR